VAKIAKLSVGWTFQTAKWIFAVFFLIQYAFFYLNLKTPLFISEEYVHYAVRTECSKVIEVLLVLNDDAMVQAVNSRQGFQLSACDICVCRSGTWTGLSPSTLVLPCHYHSTNAPYVFSADVALI
jgi:hypothetical protein